MRVIEHPHPFMLLGADVLQGGRDPSVWNFAGMTVKTLAIGKVAVSMNFETDGQEVKVPLPYAPADGGRDADGATLACTIGGAPVAGAQCLRRNF